MTLDDPNRYDLVTVPASELRPGDEFWNNLVDPPRHHYTVFSSPVIVGPATFIHEPTAHAMVRYARGVDPEMRMWPAAEPLSVRRPKADFDRDSDRLVADLLAAFAVERHADADVLVRQAIADFDTGTVLTALGSIATAFIHLAGRNYPGGPEALMATVQAELGGGS